MHFHSSRVALDGAMMSDQVLADKEDADACCEGFFGREIFT